MVASWGVGVSGKDEATTRIVGAKGADPGGPAPAGSDGPDVQLVPDQVQQLAVGTREPLPVALANLDLVLAVRVEDLHPQIDGHHEDRVVSGPPGAVAG